MARSHTASADPKARVYESVTERDHALESRTRYDREGERSTMAYVCVRAPELVMEFFAWRQGQIAAPGDVGEMLALFEHWRFGHELDRGPHSVLLFHLRCRLALDEGGRKIDPAYFERKAGVTHSRFRSVEQLAESKAMPRPPNVEREANRQREEARRSPDGPWEDR